jgi:hypothetical protein
LLLEKKMKNGTRPHAPKLISLALTCMALATVAAPTEASAQLRRNDCFAPGTAAAMGRQMGVRNAARIVQAVWLRLGQTCNQVDRLAQIISETPLARPMRGGDFAACFFQGYTDTLWDQLDQTYTRCGDRCFNAGAEIGRISAEGYCAASLAVGGLLDPGFISQPPLPFCGENLVMGCKAEYVSVATSQFPGCYAFTAGGFSNTFDNSVRQDCFVPADVPIRDHGPLSDEERLLSWVDTQLQ